MNTKWDTTVRATSLDVDLVNEDIKYTSARCWTMGDIDILVPDLIAHLVVYRAEHNLKPISKRFINSYLWIKEMEVEHPEYYKTI